MYEKSTSEEEGIKSFDDKSIFEKIVETEERFMFEEIDERSSPLGRVIIPFHNKPPKTPNPTTSSESITIIISPFFFTMKFKKIYIVISILKLINYIKLTN